MFMLCYCNGAMAREGVRDQINALSAPHADHSVWEAFNTHALRPASFEKIGVYFPLAEIIPPVHPGTWRYMYNRAAKTITPLPSGSPEWKIPQDDARAILVSQALSMRLRSASLLPVDRPMPRRIYVVGGGSKNPAIVGAVADVLGAREGVYKLDIGGNACALGAAYYAVWAGERGRGEGFADFVAERWDEEGLVKKVGEGYKEGVWEGYGELLEGYEMVEREIVEGNAK